MIVGMTAEQLAIRWLVKLDHSRHGRMMLDLRNQAARGNPYPATVQWAYDLVSKWATQVNMRSKSGDDVSSVYILSDSMPPREQRQGVSSKPAANRIASKETKRAGEKTGMQRTSHKT